MMSLQFHPPESWDYRREPAYWLVFFIAIHTTPGPGTRTWLVYTAQDSLLEFFHPLLPLLRSSVVAAIKSSQDRVGIYDLSSLYVCMKSKNIQFIRIYNF